MSGFPKDLARAIAVAFHDDYMIVRLEDTRELAVPLFWYPRLQRATTKQRENYEWIAQGIGIHWPDIDEDIEVQGMLEGRKSPEFRRGIRDIGKWFRQESAMNMKGKLAGDPGGRSVKASATASRSVQVALDRHPKNLRAKGKD